MASDSEDEVQALNTVALITGFVAAMVLFLGADPWAALWGDRGAANVIRILSVGLLVTPAVSVHMGLLRRVGRFAQLAAGSLVTSILGMLIGAWCISKSPTASSLVISPVSSTWLLYLFGILCLGRNAYPGAKLRSSLPHVSFGLRALLGSIMNFLAATVPSFAISRILGSPALGQWNRATVIGVLPIEMVTNSLSRAVYPEARNMQTDSSDQSRNQWIWTMSVAATSLLVWPGVGLVVPIMPTLVTVILGSKWSVAGSMSQFLVVGAAVMLTLTVLSALQESNGHFEIFWAGTASLMVVAGVGAFWVAYLHSWLPGVLAAVLGPILALFVQVVLSARRHLIDGTMVTKTVLQSFSLAFIFGICSKVLVLVAQAPVVLISGILLLLTVEYGIVLGLPACVPIRQRVSPSLGRFRLFTEKDSR
jgi:O-antigen/teichoic acid export membrane protein